ncbi:MAG: hypothetical protein OER86_06140, partial [Phycisphaerae bacterium]|nr:hypothetical protein [Phycisphaerae bacterium]
ADRSDLLQLATPDPQLPQASSFFHADTFRRFGGFEEMLNYQFFLDFTCRLLARGVRPAISDHVLAQHRLHTTSKTSRDRAGSRDERNAVIERQRQGVPATFPTRSTAPRRRAA